MVRKAKIGVIGGTGLYQIEGLTNVEEVNIETPFGSPSDSIIVGNLGNVTMAFLPRHGKGHHISPSELPSRANIYALKLLGVQWIIAVNSCGSFKMELAPGHLLIPDQIIDRTKDRKSSFFGEGLVAHIPFADPFCPVLSEILYQAAQDTETTIHKGGTFVAMEGPSFSTRAESKLYRSWGADIIGMTILPEAKLAREAEICYATIACITDYDSWHEHTEGVTAEGIIKVLRHNIDAAKGIISLAATRIPDEHNCECASALKTALITSPEQIPTQ
ncbi:MAG: S-methyl-5'-thioadenosine phosphorylase, partial [Dehalococcoidia bacterium]|nr:S-methyl-5'-thioadenosine phosphorylase [Dehalococcoidia bacterium]